MSKKLIPMLNVTDVGRSVEWYESIGFVLTNSFAENGDLIWASLEYGDSTLMLNTSDVIRASEDKRDAEIYIYLSDNTIYETYKMISEMIDIPDKISETFYGMTEFYITDPDGFRITFGQSSAKN